MPLHPGSVTAVIPTRGDCAVGAIVEILRCNPEIGEIRFVIGNTPFNRYKTILESKHEIWYTADDDVLTDIRPLLAAYDPKVITNAMTPEHADQYKGNQTLIGFGALFHRSLVEHAFNFYKWERDALFYRESDRIFPTVNPHKTLFPKILPLPHGEAPNRLYKQKDHGIARIQINRRILETTGISA